jgi:hypothetical protein
MGHNFAIRAAAGAVSTALLLGIGATAATASPRHRAPSAPVAATRVSSAAPAGSQRGLPDPGSSPVSLYSQDPCSPFSLTLRICADGLTYDASHASDPPSARPTPRLGARGTSDWADAAIGAALLVLVAIGIGGIRTATNHRTRHPATS